MATPSLPPKDALQRLIDSLQTLIREHLALARAEAKDDLRAMGRDMAFGAAGVPALFVGYLLLMVAIAYAIALVLPNWAAFAIVAVLNLATGAALTLVFGRRAANNGVLEHTTSELQKDRAWLGQLREATRPTEDANAQH